MKPILLLIILCCGAYIAQAQDREPVKTGNDSSALADTSMLDEIKDNVLDNIPVITLDDNESGDASSQNISSVLTAGRDPFFTAAAFNFSPARFRIRGYDADFSATYINGIPVYNLDNGFTPFGLWGGLNDVMRNRDISMGLRANTFAFGDIGINTSIDARPSKLRKQTSFGYALSNRNYTHRWMLTHNTGMSKKGWAFSFSGSRRWADEGYVPGTYYNSWSYFVGVDKRINQNNLLSLVLFGAPTENGRQGAALQEMIDLSGTNYYNPYWGYQGGKKRNASVARTNQPVAILTHDHRFNNNTSLVTAAGYSYGTRSTSGLDWYNAPDPRPDYYRYLPSYQTDPVIKDQVTALLMNDESARQINWQNLYDVNRDSYETIYNAGGIEGNNVSGVRSLYVLQRRATTTQRLNLNATINSRLSEHADLTGGVSFQWQKNHYYQQLDDLLGGEFWVDLNQFAERDFPENDDAIQNDLNNPNRIVYEGDKYGYNYDINIYRKAAWLQTVFRYEKVDFFVAFEVSTNEFNRTGNVRNGLFPDNSYGKSTTYAFKNYAIKGGITYKIDGRNYVYANFSDLTRPPYFDNAYISARTRDATQSNLVSESIQTAEAGYILNAPKLKLRLGGYYTSVSDGLNVLSFYHETYRNFVNYALSNIDRVYYGGEFGFEVKPVKNITITGAAAIGRYYYNSRQNATITLDNTAEVLENQLVYSNNYRVASTPQEAYSLGITYRSPKFWFLSLTGNYFDQMWLDFNPIRRTEPAVDGVDPKSPQWNSILDQTRLDAQYTLDFFGGYSIKLPYVVQENRPVYLAIYAGVNNLLNNKDIISGGYEQLRYDFDSQDPNQFPAKFYHAYGLNYFLSVALRF